MADVFSRKNERKINLNRSVQSLLCENSYFDSTCYLHPQPGAGYTFVLAEGNLGKGALFLDTLQCLLAFYRFAGYYWTHNFFIGRQTQTGHFLLQLQDKGSLCHFCVSKRHCFEYKKVAKRHQTEKGTSAFPGLFLPSIKQAHYDFICVMCTAFNAIGQCVKNRTQIRY